jgi:hypothetical protein
MTLRPYPLAGQTVREFRDRGCGVLLTDGTWYPCIYGGHSKLAKKLKETGIDLTHAAVISSSYQDVVYSPSKWFVILDAPDDVKLSEAQIKALEKMKKKYNDPVLTIAIMHAIEDYTL